MKSFILDTNIIIRYFIQDNPVQFKKAKEIVTSIENNRCIGYVSILVLDELIWVLEQYYELKRSQYIPQLLELLACDNLKIIEAKKEIIVDILQRMQTTHIDFTDYYLALTANKTPILSFDKDFEKIK